MVSVYLLFIWGECNDVDCLHSRSHFAPSWSQAGHTEVRRLLVCDFDVPSHLEMTIDETQFSVTCRVHPLLLALSVVCNAEILCSGPFIASIECGIQL